MIYLISVFLCFKFDSADNNFSATLPTEMGHMKSLNVLDLRKLFNDEHVFIVFSFLFTINQTVMISVHRW